MSAPTTTPTSSRPHSWMGIPTDIVSLRNRFRSVSTGRKPKSLERPVALPPIISPCSRKSALKRSSSDLPPRRSFSDSGPSPPFTSSAIHIEFPVRAASYSPADGAQPRETFGDELNPPAPVQPTSLTHKISPHALLERVRSIYLFTHSHCHKRTSRTFPDLPPPADWDEVSLTIESEDSDDDKICTPMARKVRFVVPAPPPPPSPEPEWEEPAWSDFMVLLFLIFFINNDLMHRLQ
ncbi:hypothetical protein B0H19DRAFT_1145983 [Mycena capillaripes]|nr:hypothetical protein B0H19DRAFT_1145983 [Mycena capillaripes]